MAPLRMKGLGESGLDDEKEKIDNVEALICDGREKKHSRAVLDWRCRSQVASDSHTLGDQFGLVDLVGCRSLVERKGQKWRRRGLDSKWTDAGRSKAVAEWLTSIQVPRKRCKHLSVWRWAAQVLQQLCIQVQLSCAHQLTVSAPGPGVLVGRRGAATRRER